MIFFPQGDASKKISEKAGWPFHRLCNWDRETLISDPLGQSSYELMGL